MAVWAALCEQYHEFLPDRCQTYTIDETPLFPPEGCDPTSADHCQGIPSSSGLPSGLVGLFDLGKGEKGALLFFQFPKRPLVALLPEPPGAHPVVGFQGGMDFPPLISVMIATSRR